MYLYYYIISFFLLSYVEYIDNNNDIIFRDYLIEFMLGKENISKDTTFIKLPKQYVAYEPQYMNKYAANDFIKMYLHAKSDGINLTIISAYRSFETQKSLWNLAWEKNKNLFLDKKELIIFLLDYIAMPGTSRHHWGTDIDLCNTEELWWKTYQGIKTYEWLNKNAAKYGFFQPYGIIGISRLTGYQEEKWHWSYAPIANQIQQQYSNVINYSHLKGYQGAEYAEDIDVIKNYVLSVENFNQN